MEKKPKNATYIYEALIHFRGFEERISVVLDDDEWERIVYVLENEDAPRFYGFSPVDGVDIHINLEFVTKINLLENLPGILFKKRPKLSEAKAERLYKEREESTAPVVFRLWFHDSLSREVHSDVSHEEWTGIQFELQEGGAKFFGFTDGDGERVLYNLANLVAIEVYDEHYLSWEEIEKKLEDGNGNSQDQTVPTVES